jgi:DNA-binding protein H-NS
MTLEELVIARAKIDAAIELYRAREHQALMRMLERGQASAMKRLRATAHPLTGRKIPPKYRNPADHSQVWSGRGNKPRWLTAALRKRGVHLASFAIGSAAN